MYVRIGVHSETWSLQNGSSIKLSNHTSPTHLPALTFLLFPSMITKKVNRDFWENSCGAWCYVACSKLSADVAIAANECVCCKHWVKQGCAEFLSDKKIVEGHMCLMYMHLCKLKPTSQVCCVYGLIIISLTLKLACVHLPSTIACMFCLGQFV